MTACSVSRHISFSDIAASIFVFHNTVRPRKDRARPLAGAGSAGRSGPRRTEKSMNRFITGAAMAALLLGAAGSASAADWFPISVEVWDPPFDMASPRTTVDYVPVDKASKPWEICVSFPHMKDAYWLAV